MTFQVWSPEEVRLPVRAAALDGLWQVAIKANEPNIQHFRVNFRALTLTTVSNISKSESVEYKWSSIRPLVPVS